MQKNYAEAISEIQSYMASKGGNWSDWYVGITGDVRSRLFSEHGVDERQDCWIWRQCANSLVARQVEEYFVKKGSQGDTGGGDFTSEFVYVYLITKTTRQ